ncbi:MAG: hypothetical protein AAGG48_29195 [Planctomycetota bacterium]
MTFDVVIKQEAHDAILRNALWWRDHHSVDQAIEWQATIYSQLAELQSMPERHGLAPENHRFPFELRQQLLGKGKRGSYRALFRIEGSTVEVLGFYAAEQDEVLSSDL